uniref:Uncharacterized protein n=1 Tax=Rhizophora mucronata TaxID=61149 RepID=A0A2P2J5S3_RHIMU
MDLGGEDILQLEQESHSGADIQVIGSHGGGEESDFVAGSPRHVPSDDFTLSAHDEREMSVVTGQVSDASCTELDQLDSSILDVKTIVRPCQDEIGELDSTSSSFQRAFENRTLPIVEEEHPPVVVKSIPEEPILCSQEAEHVEEHAVGGEHILQLEQEPHSGAGIQVNGSQGGVEELDFVAGSPKHMPLDDFNLSPHDEREMSVVTRQVSGAFPDISSSETKHLEEHPLRRDKTILSEQDPVHSSNSDVTIDANSHQDVNVIVASSSYQHVHSDEKSLLEFEKRPSWADKSIIEPSSNDHSELQEPSGALARIPEEVNNTSNISALNIHDHEDKLSRITTSFTSDSTSVPSDSPEYKTPATGLYLKNNILDKFVYKDSDHVLERSNSSAEAYGSPMGELYEDYIEIKEIDEGLLSELDAVGDFSVKEVLGESLHDEQMTGENNSGSLNSDMLPNGSSLTEIPVLEIRSIEDFDLAFEQLHERADVGEVIPPNEIKNQFFEHEPSGLGQTSSELLVAEAKSLEDVHITMNQDSRENFDEPSRPSNSKDVVVAVKEAGSTKDLPVLEVQTVEDIGLAFEPLQEGADVEDVIIPSVTEQSPVANELKDPGQTSANLQVVEARSLEDINTAMKQVLEGNTEEQSRSSHLKDKTAKGDELGSTNEIPILEARTFEDINLAFKQLEEGADVEEVILPSSFERQLVVDESNDSGRTNSHLHVVQAKSLEDIHVAMKHVSGSNTENIPEAADPKDGWEKVDEVSASGDNTSRMLEANDVNFTKDMEAIEVGSTKESRSSNVEPSVHETSSTDA